MKTVLIAFTILVSASFAHANEYSLKEICKNDPKEKRAFAEDLRDQIVEKTKDIKEQDATAAKLFNDSDMYDWLLLTYPTYLPRYLFDAGAKECANMHLDYLDEDSDKKSVKKFDAWKQCLMVSYKNSLPPMAEALIKCYAGTPSVAK